MALTSWPVFNFFDVTQVSLPDPSLFNGSNYSSLASGSESLFLGTQDGRVHILSSAFKLVRTFVAYEPGTGAITHLKQVNGTALLVTVAEDLSSEPLLKVWALDKIEKKTNTPRCLSSLGIQNGRRQFPITAFAALEDLSQLAFGFGNGAVTLVRGDLIHDRGAKQRTVFESAEPVTGVAFREGGNTTLYLATTGRILTLTIAGRGQGQPARPLEDVGCGAGCMTVDKEAGEVVVVRNDRISYYGVRGRGPSIAYEGPKKLVRVFRHYVALVSQPQASKSVKANTMRLFGGRQADDLFTTSAFALLDTDQRYLAHTENLTSEVREVFAEWGDFFIITIDGKVFRYHEKPLQQKLEILYSRNLYLYAINFAQKANLDAAHRNVILRKYGDYLYQKGDYDTAMQQYLKAIDNTEPSQVIRKFLDTARIRNLIEYLEELHEHDRATVDHTTLLLNCYAKLKDTKKLEDFINSGSNFDFDTAISMCRQGGYYDQAVFLARKHDEHEIVVDVLIEDSKKYTEALDYIWRLPAEKAYPNLMKYARVLLEHCSQDTTQLFIDYYIGKYKPKTDSMPLAVESQGGSRALPALTSFIPLPYRQASSNTVAKAQAVTGEGNVMSDESEETATIKPKYDVPKPRTAFSAFMDHPDEFMHFLEACVKQENFNESDKVDLYTTLFEVYLEAATHREGNEKLGFENKARQLIDSKSIPIDPSNILLLSHLNDYSDGTTLVRERQGQRADIFRSYTAARDTAGAIKALRKYGPDEPSLYPAALAYFTSTEEILAEAGGEVDAVLRTIHRDGLLAPLQVVQTLSQNSVAKMGLVKHYLGTVIAQERKAIESHRRLAESYRAQTAAKRAELAALAGRPTVFQARRCAQCGKALDLPTVHFLCKHSFHQHCLNLPATPPPSRGRGAAARRSAGVGSDDEELSHEPAEPECPICAKENETLRAIRKAQKDAAGRHDLFKEELTRSRDGLQTVSDFFGRGVMDEGMGSD